MDLFIFVKCDVLKKKKISFESHTCRLLEKKKCEISILTKLYVCI